MTSVIDLLAVLVLTCGLLAGLGYGARYGARLLRRMFNRLDFHDADRRWWRNNATR